MYKSLVYKKIFVSTYIIFYILCLPLYSYSSTLTFNQFMKLTTAGVAKVAPRAATVGMGVWAARALLGVSGVGLAVTVAMGVHDLYSLWKEVTLVNVSQPAVAPPMLPPAPTLYPAGTTSGQKGNWGSQTGTQMIFVNRVDNGTCIYNAGSASYTWNSNITVTGNVVPDGHYVVGGYSAISTYYCPPVTQIYQQIDYVYYLPFPSPAALPSGVFAVDTTPLTSTVPIQNREEIQTLLADAQSRTAAAMASSPTSQKYYQQMYNYVVAAQTALKSVPLGLGDYTTTGEAPAENTFPVGTDPDALSFPPEVPPVPPDEPPSGDVPPVPNDACSYYQRAKHFDYSSLLQSAQAVPLLGLLSKLIINPAAGQFNGKVNFQLSKFGAQEIDLNKWHYSDAIAIFRFVIIGGAFLTAIRIIYD